MQTEFANLFIVDNKIQSSANNQQNIQTDMTRDGKNIFETQQD